MDREINIKIDKQTEGQTRRQTKINIYQNKYIHDREKDR